MATTILLAPVGAGKTERVLASLVETLDEQPFAKVWVLLATKRQEDHFRQRLVETQRQVFFNVEFYNFYELYQRLLDMAGNPQRQLTDSARTVLLRAIITELQPRFELYGNIADTPGFVRIVADFINELKQSRIYPEDLQRMAATPKDRDLALIYQAYQERLQTYRLMDKEGQGWLAVDELLTDARLAGDLRLLVVDGFDQFTPVQADLLSLLADRAEDTLITLTRVTGREATVGRRFERALNELQKRFHYPLVEILELADDGRHDDLRYLMQNIFLRDAPKRASSGGIRLIEAPDPAGEVGAVLRQVKRLLLHGTAPDDIIIALRDWERYRIHFSTFGKKYGLPLALHYGLPLGESPAVIAFMNLLELHRNDFRRRDVLDVLRSPYFSISLSPDRGQHAAPLFTLQDVDMLERVSLQFTVLGGRRVWLESILRASKPLRSEDDEPDTVLLTVDEAQMLCDRLEAFFDAMIPPLEATVAEYVLWLENLIGHDPDKNPEDDPVSIVPKPFTLDMIACIRCETAPDDIIAHDLAAMSEFKHVLRGLLMAAKLLHSVGEAADSPVSWDSFFADLRRGIASVSINPRPNRSGRVLVTTASDARGLPHSHVFVLGLSEGVFPAQVVEDPLYLDGERRALNARAAAKEAHFELDTRSERAADDGLFYEMICLSRETLTLSRPTLQDGNPWIESPLWRAAAQVFSDSAELISRERIGVGQVVPIRDAAARDEVVTAAVAGFVVGDDRILPAYAWLRTAESDYWQHVETGWRIETGRLVGRRYDQFSGRLRDAALIEQIARKLSRARVWSASQLNDYGVCGFRFFAKRLLRLEALEEPEEGMDAAQRGTLIHAILERTYRTLRDEGVVISPEYLDRALAVLNQAADFEFATAPERIGFRATALWKQEQASLRRKLQKLVQVDFSGDSPVNKKFGSLPRQPYILEAPFGIETPVEIDLGGEAGRIQLQGFIDRMDCLGDRVLVMDYKSGSTPIPVSEMESGRNFQMMVYLEGAKAILARRGHESADVVGGLFWHVSNQEISGDIHMDANGESSVNAAKAHLARYIAAGRQGDFAVHASRPDGGRCVRYCEFSQLCRVSSTNRRKQ